MKSSPRGATSWLLRFTGKLTEQPRGLYIARYQKKNGVSGKAPRHTKWRPSTAGACFPCWDEPVFRAAFELTAVVPEKAPRTFQYARDLGKNRRATGWREVVFASTPKMASYPSSPLPSVTSRNCATKSTASNSPSSPHQASVSRRGYALESTKRILGYYHQYFRPQVSVAEARSARHSQHWRGAAMEKLGAASSTTTTPCSTTRRRVRRATREHVLRSRGARDRAPVVWQSRGPWAGGTISG